MSYAIARNGDTIDLICFERYGDTPGIVEQVLSHHKNKHITSAQLNSDQKVYLPETTTIQTVEQQTIKLWS